MEHREVVYRPTVPVPLFFDSEFLMRHPRCEATVKKNFKVKKYETKEVKADGEKYLFTIVNSILAKVLT